eukprot:1180953-Prorocentrum_minimum.AAC.3
MSDRLMQRAKSHELESACDSKQTRAGGRILKRAVETRPKGLENIGGACTHRSRLTHTRPSVVGKVG